MSIGNGDQHLVWSDVMVLLQPTIKVDTFETQRLVLGASLAVHGKPQITASYQSRSSTEDKRTDSFFPEVSMTSFIDDEYPMPLEARQGMFGSTISSLA